LLFWRFLREKIAELNKNSELVNPPVLEIYPNNMNYSPENEQREYTQEEIDKIVHRLKALSKNKCFIVNISIIEVYNDSI